MMNRLYLLGALALAEVSAYINGGTTIADPSPTTTITFVQTTYTGSTDCFTTGTATTLGMNNIYYQYYSFSISAGTQTYATFETDPATPNIVNKVTNAVNGCTHEHLYNWMAQPVIGSSAVTDGIGDALVAYGYVMGGTTLAACTLTVTAVTTTLFSSSIFSGGRFQYVNSILTLGTTSISSTTITTLGVNMLTHYGLGSLQTIAATVQALDGPAIIAGIVTASAQNFYYDFAQQQVVQGQTQFGRGGGSSTAPCGWWVFYAHEGGIDSDGGLTPVSAWNVLGGWQSITVHMWTDNALMNTIGAFTIATLAALY